MATVLAFLVTTAVVVVLFHVVDWMWWSTRWGRERALRGMSKEVWRISMEAKSTERDRELLVWGVVVTTAAAAALVPLVWVLGPRFMGLRSVYLGLLLWLAIEVPRLAQMGIFLNVPWRFALFQATSAAVRMVGGVVMVVWLLTIFRLWR